MNKDKEFKGEIKFIHSDGKQYHFVTKRNFLNNHQMYSWTNWGDCYASDLGHVKSIIRDLYKKAKIVASTFDKEPFVLKITKGEIT